MNQYEQIPNINNQFFFIHGTIHHQI
jgi:hypothetical protein